MQGSECFFRGPDFDPFDPFDPVLLAARKIDDLFFFARPPPSHPLVNVRQRLSAPVGDLVPLPGDLGSLNSSILAVRHVAGTPARCRSSVLRQGGPRSPPIWGRSIAHRGRRRSRPIHYSIRVHSIAHGGRRCPAISPSIRPWTCPTIQRRPISKRSSPARPQGLCRDIRCGSGGTGGGVLCCAEPGPAGDGVRKDERGRQEDQGACMYYA